MKTLTLIFKTVIYILRKTKGNKSYFMYNDAAVTLIRTVKDNKTKT